MKYLNINLSNIDTINLVKEKIDNDVPFALTRFGDGEIYILNNNQPIDVQKRFSRNWGYKWPDELDKGIKTATSILNTALQSDVVGLLDPVYTTNLNGLVYSKKHWSISNDYIKSIDLNPNTIKICNHQITRMKEFGDPYEFKKIINGRPINIVSPNVELLKQNNLHDILETDISYTKIDSNMTLEHRENYFERISGIKETIVIFGGAAGSKDTGVFLKNKGKISIDFGATLDAWAGIASRHWFNKNNVQEHCLIVQKR